MLTVAAGPPANLLRLAQYIQMDRWGYSFNGPPLFTWGAGPCLNVAVHRYNEGCFSHVGQFPTLRGASSDDNIFLSKTQLYHKACFTILKMIDEGIGGRGNIEIWLGAGHSYRNASAFSTRDIPHYDFLEYLTRFLAETGIRPARIIDDRRTGPMDQGNVLPGHDPGDVLYDPTTECVYYLTGNELRQAQQAPVLPFAFGEVI